jgi:hypothetical protein
LDVYGAIPGYVGGDVTSHQALVPVATKRLDTSVLMYAISPAKGELTPLTTQVFSLKS